MWIDLLQLLVILGALGLFARYFVGVGIGAPYLPVRTRDLADALVLAEIGPEDVVVDLGSGDGKVLVAAAARGARVIGYELNPILVWISRYRLRRFGDRARVVRQDFRTGFLDAPSVIFSFQLTGMMPGIALQWEREGRPGSRLVTVAFPLPNRVPDAERGAAFLYRKPLS